MSHTDNQLIEKFSGTFEKEDSGCSILINSTVNSIKDMDVLGLYCYLACRPSGWKIHPKHLLKHFACSKDKVYKMLNCLIDMGLLSVTKIRDQGRFVGTRYKLHTKPIEPTRTQIDTPCPDLPDTATPDTEKPDAYKTKKLPIKEKDINNTVDSVESPPDDYKACALFMAFYAIYPRKEKPQRAYKSFLKLKPNQDFVSMLCEDVQQRVQNNWKNRPKSKIPHPSTYLNDREWESEIFLNQEKGQDNGHQWDIDSVMRA